MGRGGLPSACNPSFFSVAGFGDEPEAVGEANPKPPSTPASATTCLTLVIAAPCGTCAGSRIGRTRTLNDAIQLCQVFVFRNFQSSLSDRSCIDDG